MVPPSCFFLQNQRFPLESYKNQSNLIVFNRIHSTMGGRLTKPVYLWFYDKKAIQKKQKYTKEDEHYGALREKNGTVDKF